MLYCFFFNKLKEKKLKVELNFSMKVMKTY